LAKIKINDSTTGQQLEFTVGRQSVSSDLILELTVAVEAARVDKETVGFGFGFNIVKVNGLALETVAVTALVRLGIKDSQHLGLSVLDTLVVRFNDSVTTVVAIVV